MTDVVGGTSFAEAERQAMRYALRKGVDVVVFCFGESEYRVTAVRAREEYSLERIRSNIESDQSMITKLTAVILLLRRKINREMALGRELHGEVAFPSRASGGDSSED